MATIIKNKTVATDPWQLLKLPDDGALPAIPATGDIIVPLALWLDQREMLVARKSGKLGVWLAPHHDPSEITGDLGHFTVIAVDFPQFTDGRGYSIARLLRERYGWAGELRAIGDVQRDQLFYLSRCGFDAFALREGQDAQRAMSGFSDFSDGYQTSVERPLPLFRRRHLASSDGTEWS